MIDYERVELQDNWRNWLAFRVINLGLRIAEKSYADLLRGAANYGLSANLRDDREGRESPPDWRDEIDRFKGMAGQAPDADRTE